MTDYQPFDPRQAKAEAKAEKARAKSLRPWYRRKRWWLAGAVVLIIVISAVASAGGNDDAEPVAADDTAEPAEQDDTRNLDLYPNRPDRQDDDHEAAVGDEVRLAGYSATVTRAELGDDGLGGQQVTVFVDVANRDETAQPYNMFDWRLQNANGQVVDPTISLRDDALQSGDLVGGGNTSGTVAFDVGPGTYFVIYKPDPFNNARGIWRIEVGT